MKLLINNKQLGFFIEGTVYWYSSIFKKSILSQIDMTHHNMSDKTVVL